MVRGGRAYVRGGAWTRDAFGPRGRRGSGGYWGRAGSWPAGHSSGLSRGRCPTVGALGVPVAAGDDGKRFRGRPEQAQPPVRESQAPSRCLSGLPRSRPQRDTFEKSKEGTFGRCRADVAPRAPSILFKPGLLRRPAEWKARRREVGS